MDYEATCQGYEEDWIAHALELQFRGQSVSGKRKIKTSGKIGWLAAALYVKRPELFVAMKITEALFAEHLVFHNMFDHLDARVPTIRTLAELKALAAVMESMLKAHSDTEDNLFIGPLEHCFEQIGQRDHFLQEHKEMDGNLQLVQQATRLESARRLLLAAVAHSRHHFDKEERIVFPMAERMLNSKTLNSLGQSWMEQRNRVSV